MEIGKSEFNKDDINCRFGFHKPDADGVAKITTIRKKVRELAMLIEESCPLSQEKVNAHSHLAIVMMMANSAIVQAFPLDPEDFK